MKEEQQSLTGTARDLLRPPASGFGESDVELAAAGEARTQAPFRRAIWRVAVPLATLGAAALAGTQVWLHARQPTDSLPDMATSMNGLAEVTPDGFCGEVDEGIEFHTRKTLYWVGNIYSQRMCCAECDADPDCNAWTYGKERGVEGFTDHCYLKKLERGEKPEKVNRSGAVSGLISKRLRKHGIVAELLANEDGTRQPHDLEPPIRANETCPGGIDVKGHGRMHVVSALWKVPGERAAHVEVPEADWVVIPHLNSRAYFAENCTPGEYDRKTYPALKLLGGSIRYTTDISEVGCGCNAQFHLIPMRHNHDESKCHDYYCTHGWSKCGAQCADIGLQDSNQYAWSSNVHAHDDPGGKSNGYGGGTNWIGRRDWNDTQYGPGARCIDTSWPFDVEISFPVNNDGILEAMEVTLSQEGHDCPLQVRIDEYYFAGRNALLEISKVLRIGVTPVFSYWSSPQMQWMDGAGKDGGGPCVKDTPEACPSSTRFYNFEIRHRINEEANHTQTSLMDTAIGALHKHVLHKKEEERQAALDKLQENKSLAAESHCDDNCKQATSAGSQAKQANETGQEQNLTEIDEDEDGNEFVEMTSGQKEWEVIYSQISIMKSAESTGKVIGKRLEGEILIGKQSGEWIKLARGGGYAMIREGEHVFLRERVVAYKKLVHGSCADAGMVPILDTMTCTAAAFALGYFDTSVRTYHGTEKRPEGCYLQDGEVWLSTSASNTGNGAEGTINPICSSKAYPTTTSTSSTTTSSTTSITTTTTSTTITTTSTTTWGWPSLFCVEVVRTHGYELPLVKNQQKMRTSIFQCDEYVVFSDGGVSRVVGIDPAGQQIKTIVIPPIKESVGNLGAGATTNSWLNTETFLQVWDIAKRDGRYQRHDWTVKVDPDAVFFPDRLRNRLKSHTYKGAHLYVMNCNRFNPVALYGSMEVFSKGALDTYLRGQGKCRANLPWHGWGEDYFMSHCMDMLGVGRIYEFSMLSDKRCFYSPCSDKSKVLYHDYKDSSLHGSWFQCYNQSVAM